MVFRDQMIGYYLQSKVSGPVDLPAMLTLIGAELTEHAVVGMIMADPRVLLQPFLWEELVFYSSSFLVQNCWWNLRHGHGRRYCHCVFGRRRRRFGVRAVGIGSNLVGPFRDRQSTGGSDVDGHDGRYWGCRNCTVTQLTVGSAVVSVQLDCNCHFLRRVNWRQWSVTTCFKKSIYSFVARRNLRFH